MKKWLLRLQGLDDDQIRLKGRRYGWMCIVLAFVLLLGSGSLAFWAAPIIERLNAQDERIFAAWDSDPTWAQLDEELAEDVERLMIAYSDFLRGAWIPMAMAFVGVGFCMIQVGLLYFKLHKVLNTAAASPDSSTTK